MFLGFKTTPVLSNNSPRTKNVIPIFLPLKTESKQHFLSLLGVFLKGENYIFLNLFLSRSRKEYCRKISIHLSLEWRYDTPKTIFEVRHVKSTLRRRSSPVSSQVSHPSSVDVSLRGSPQRVEVPHRLTRWRLNGRNKDGLLFGQPSMRSPPCHPPPSTTGFKGPNSCAADVFVRKRLPHCQNGYKNDRRNTFVPIYRGTMTRRELRNLSNKQFTGWNWWNST